MNFFSKVFKRLSIEFKATFSKESNIQGIRIKLDRKLIQKKIIRRMMRNRYEHKELEMLSVTLRPGDRVLELGAGIGLISIACAQKIGSENVFTFEANPLLVPLIKNNYLINNVSPDLSNVVLLTNTFSESSDFYISKNFYSSSLEPFADYKEIIKVPNKSFLDTLNHIRPNFLIIDIEGFEYTLFKDFVFPAFIQKIAIELHPKKVSEMSLYNFEFHLQKQGFIFDETLSSTDQLYGYR